MTTYTAEQVRTALPYTVRQYAGTVTDAVNRRGADRDTLEQVVRTIGGRPENYQREITEFLANLTASTTITEAAEGTPESGFDRAEAAGILIAIGAREGLRPQMVRDALLEAGLLDPEPEPVNMAEDAPAGDVMSRIEQAIAEMGRQVNGLVAFARRHGFNG